MYDIAIIGGGPAGLSAGIYASRARMKTVMIESMSVMGQLTMTDEIENYPGIVKMGGFDLVDTMKKQAVSFGLESILANVNSISKTDDGYFTIEYDSKTLKAMSVIIATGAQPRKLDVPGEKELTGKGVSYCATCDAAFFREKEVVVIGGGDTAVEEAIYLTKFANKVTIIHRKDRLRAVKSIQEKAFANKKIDFIWKSIVKEIRGNIKVEKIILSNVDTGQIEEKNCDGVFVFTGWTPNTNFLNSFLKLHDSGNIIVDADMKTGLEGVFSPLLTAILKMVYNFLSRLNLL
ncbi:MAG: FAD-dependent oxidoreductase [Candidatus Omnitrophica bacterium]|nr:FAD-dependent oxidoreductase [Candidatus Omnitrophota bacterium]